MMFLSTVCNACNRLTIVDGNDDVSYCMHCGATFSEDDLVNAEVMSPDSFESMMYDDCPELNDYSDRPWFDSLLEVIDLLDAGNASGAVEAMDALLGSDPGNDELFQAGKLALFTWVGEQLTTEPGYRGGAMEVARVLSKYNAEFHPSSLTYVVICTAGAVIESLDALPQVISLVRSMFVSTVELATVENDIRMLLEACTEFMHNSSECIEAADSLIESDEEMEQTTESIYRLQDFIKVFGDGIFDAIPGDESKVDALVSVWEGLDIFETGAKIMDLAVRFLDEDVDPEEIKAAVDEYTFEYTSVLPA